MRTARLPSLDPNVTKCAVSSVGVGSSHDGTVTSTGIVKYLVEYVGPEGATADVVEDADVVGPPPPQAASTKTAMPVAAQAILDRNERFMVTPTPTSWSMVRWSTRTGRRGSSAGRRSGAACRRGRW